MRTLLRIRHGRIPSWPALGLLLVLHAGCASAPRTEPGVLLPGFPIEAEVSRTAALFHWIDSLAGTSPGKTVPAYRRQYEWNFGAPTEQDNAELARFTEWRRRALHSLSPVWEDGLPIGPGAVPLFRFLQSDSVDEALDRLGQELPPQDVTELRSVLEYFAPRHELVWRDGRVASAFLRRAEADQYAQRRLEELLTACAHFFGHDPAALPRPRLVLVPVPGGYGTHAQALGRQLLIEIREGDELRHQAPVIVHENAHLMWYAVGEERLDALERAAGESGKRGEAAFVLLREALPTALGQGIADRRFNPLHWSRRVPWYHVRQIDAYAKALLPQLDEALRSGGVFDEDFVRRAVAVLPREDQP